MRNPKIKFVSVLFGALLLLNGCAMQIPFFSDPGNYLEQIDIAVAPDANLHTPVAIDLVWLTQDEQLKSLSALSGPEWFRKKQKYLYLYGSSISITSAEPVPGSLPQSLPLPEDSEDFIQVLLFADYRAESGHMAAMLGQFEHLRITLLYNTYQLTELEQ